jgi:drug/metabolite transporter (DMT)-like permease
MVLCIYVVVSGTPHGILGPPGTRLELWLMATFSVAATIPIMFTLNLLTLSEHVTVMCTLPFVTAFMSWLWLGERFTRTQAICCCRSFHLLAFYAADGRIVICIAGVMIITDPFRVREPATAHGREDGIPDTLSGKLTGIGLTLLGVCLRAPQCKSPARCFLSWVMTDEIVVLVRKLGNRATTAQILTITYIVLAVSAPM